MSEMRKISYRDAVREAMVEEMRRDEKVFLMGEDIGVYDGAFGVSKGMIAEFGPERVRETPISEQAFVGAGVGAAITGMRPIVELMFSDFMTVCYDQIINQAAKMHFMFAGKVSVPMVIRTAAGGGTGAAAQHSQSLEQMYLHVPGLKVVVPSTPYDAKGLLKQAIRDNNPVIFLEQKKLYNVKGMVPDEDYTIPFGVADVKREGTDVSIFTNTIIESVKKTHKAVIVHESVQFGGFGGEVAAQITDSEAFYYLDAPIKRVGALYCPVPFNPTLEAETFPTPAKIEAAVRDVL